MSRLWQVLDETRGLALSRAGWRERLGCDGGAAWELLTAMGELSAAIPVPGRPHERYIVTEVADGEFEGLNSVTDEIVPLNRSDLVCFEFDVSKLAKFLVECIGFTPRAQNLGKPIYRFQLGQYGKLDGAGFSLFFAKANSADQIDICVDMLIVMHPQPFVLFVTTDEMLSERTRRIVSQQTSRLALTLDATLVLNEEQQWTLSQQARDAIGRNTAIDAAETELVFLLDDDQIVTPDLHLDRVYQRFNEHNLDILAVRQGGGGQPMMLSPLMNGKRIWMHRGEYKRVGPVCWCDMVKRSRAIVERWGNRPPDSFELENITHVETAANLLAAYPNLQIIVSGSQDRQMKSCDAIPNHDRCGQFAATHTSYLNLIKLLLRIGPNASRFQAVLSAGC